MRLGNQNLIARNMLQRRASGRPSHFQLLHKGSVLKREYQRPAGEVLVLYPVLSVKSTSAFWIQKAQCKNVNGQFSDSM
jgi:hypothetical protein